MSQFKGTPGEWFSMGSWVFCLCEHPEPNPRMPALVNRFSLKVNRDNGIASLEEIEANARLIAAAPDLLNAITELADLIDYIRTDVNGVPDDITSDARLAIAKATGGRA